MLRKMLSIRHWRHVLSKVLKIIMSPNVPVKEKLLFGVPVLLYWVLPDAIPFMPLDDIALTMLAAHWFADRIERKYGKSDSRWK